MVTITSALPNEAEWSQTKVKPAATLKIPGCQFYRHDGENVASDLKRSDGVNSKRPHAVEVFPAVPLGALHPHSSALS